jgi:membrane-bound lytic murein transglycosylase B
MFLKFITIIILFFINFSALASNNISKEEVGFSKWQKKLEKEAKKQDYSEEFLKAVFQEIHFTKKYVKQDKKQFKPQTFDDYYANAVNYLRIKRSKNYLQTNKIILDEISQTFSVQKEFLVALLAIETDFGKIKSSDNIFNALANLSYDKRRRSLFLKEFNAALKVAKINNIKPKNFKSSWAGAFGMCQFLPSTYLKHGFDYDDDYKTDIWNNKKDILASIANYLSNIGWNNKLPWGYEIKVSDQLINNIKLKTRYNLDYLITKHNLTKEDGKFFNDYEKLEQVKIIKIGSKLYLTFNNFDLIKEWNNSSYFALTVGLIYDIIS